MPRVQVRAELRQPRQLAAVPVRSEWRSIRDVHVHHADRPNRSGDQAGRAVRLARKAPLHLDRRLARENRHAVVRGLAEDGGVVAQLREGGGGEPLRHALDLLQAEHVWLLLRERGGDGRQARGDGVHIPGSDAHQQAPGAGGSWPSRWRRARSCAGRGESGRPRRGPAGSARRGSAAWARDAKRRVPRHPPLVPCSVGCQYGLPIAAHSLEAARAVDRLVAAWLERHVRHPAALGTDGVEHLARAARVATAVAATAVAAVAVVGHASAAAHAGLARGAALGAAPGLVGEPLLGEELLLPCGEGELLPTLPANERTVDETHECLLETLGWVKAEAS